MEQLNNEMRRVLLFGGWIDEGCAQQLVLLEYKIDGGTRLMLSITSHFLHSKIFVLLSY